MPVLDLMHINIRVPRERLLEVRDFYRDAIGLLEGARPPFKSEGVWMYARNQPLVHLVIGKEDGLADATTRTTLDHVAFGSADFDAMRSALDRRGIAYIVRDVPMLGQRQIFCHDPVGNGVELLFANAPGHPADN
jgi:catechol 2,3-dioxygenase-like lactoylglutathione lyase family enzyme